MDAQRIAFVTPEFVTEPYFAGGLANTLDRVTRALVERGHEVVVVVRSDEEPRRLEHHGVEVRRVGGGWLLRWAGRLLFGRLAETARALDFSLEAYRELRRLHAERPLSVVQSPSYFACGLLALWWLRVPHVVRITSYRPLMNELEGLVRGPDRRAVEWLEALQLRRTRHHFAPSRVVAATIERELGIRHVPVIRSPIYLETGARDPSVVEERIGTHPFLLYVGRLQRLKGFDLLVDALPGFLTEHPEARVVCAGGDATSPNGDSMQALARQRCAAFPDRLIFTGALRHEQLYPLIAAAKLVVLPSRMDNLPNACLEAMALGRPVLGTRGASFDEVLRDGESGFLAPAGDGAALAEKLAEAWSHPRLKQIGEAARRESELLGVEPTIGALLDLYRRVLESEGPAANRPA